MVVENSKFVYTFRGLSLRNYKTAETSVPVRTLLSKVLSISILKLNALNMIKKIARETFMPH